MVCGSRTLRQLGLLIWKNFILQVRRPVGTVFELILPTLAVLFIIALKFAIFDGLRREQCFVTFDSDHLTVPSALAFPPSTYHIYYSPNTTQVSEIMGLVETSLPDPGDYDIIGFDDEDSMVSTLVNLTRTGVPACFVGGAGIVFDQLGGNGSSDFEYTIRLRHDVGRKDSWDTLTRAQTLTTPGPRVSPNLYLAEGFLHIQNLVGQAIIDWIMNQDGVPLQDVDISVRQMPYPPYTVDLFLSSIGSFLPLFMTMAFLYSAGTTVKELVLEKELRIRESMLMMGLNQGTLWLSWYIKQFLFLLVSVLTMSLLLKFGQAFPRSDVFLLIIFFTLFIFSMISFCFFVSVWFNSARIGLIVGFVAWFVNYMPILFLAIRYDDLPLGAKLGSCLLSNTCMGLGIQVLSILELRGDGVLWSNFAQPVSEDDPFSFIHILGMLLLDSIVYMLMAWYIDGIKPGTYGVPKPLYFPFMPSYWLGRHTGSTAVPKILPTLEDELDFDPSAHEEVTNHPEIGISIQNLTKIYQQSLFGFCGKKKDEAIRLKAVDNLSFDMYKGQITALLGHNGAGKTTTMSILTGLFTPSGGTASINGFSILSEMDSVRSSLGLCPQHNILFDRLTVEEHLKFFIRLKGTTGNVSDEILAMVEDLQLLDKMNTQSRFLSGGMKRKLSVGIALVGGSEIVILDEPTSGMDPYARRATWDLLIKHKRDRTILLTTHFMDEADLLGDRIAIMAEGRLKCSGTSFFLKSRYGVGYHMTLVKDPDCDSSQVEQLISSLVPEANKVTDVGAELTFVLPSSSTPQFPQLFDTLEAQKQQLGISSFGVSVTTLEEVFMKVGEDSVSEAVPEPVMEQEEPAKRPQNATRETTALLSDEDVTLTEEPALMYTYFPNRGVILWFQQFYAMFLKRVYNSARFWGAVVSQLLLPLGFVLFGLVLAVTATSTNGDDPKRLLGLQNSAPSVSNISLFFAQFSDSSNLNFSDLNAVDVNATDLFDFTSRAMSLVQQVADNPPTDIQDCCRYQYQILDKFCVSNNAGELTTACEDKPEFGYQRCSQCLECCNATSLNRTLQSCSSPNSLFAGSTNSENFCPRPPKLSTADTGSSGPMDNDINLFVAEYLLNLSSLLQPTTFFREFQAGFTLAPREPPLSVCSCGAPSVDQAACTFFSPLQPINESSQCPRYNINAAGCSTLWTACLRGLKFGDIDPCSILQQTGNCATLEADTPDLSNICRNNTSSISECYSVDGLAGDVIKEKACNSKDLTRGCNSVSYSSRPVYSTYIDQESSQQLAFTVWYNNQPYHMSAAALNTLHNILLRKLTGNQGYSLKVNNHPLPRNLSVKVSDAAGDATGFGIGILIVFGFSFLLASFVLFLVKEKESKAKHIQFVSGVFPSSYWLATFAWDLLNAMIPVLASVILFAAFQVEAFTGEGLAAVFILLALTCWSSIPFAYAFSFLFSNALAAFGLLVLVFFFVAMLTLTVVFLVALNVGTSEADIIHYIFLIFPTYGLSAGFNDLYANQNTKRVCSQPGAEQFCANNTLLRYVDNPLDFQRPGIGVILVFMLIEGFLLFGFTLALERKFFIPELRSLLARSKLPTPEINNSSLKEDEDVFNERKRVSEGVPANTVVLLDNLTKTYRIWQAGCCSTHQKTAVNGLSLAIPTGECFGLLGVNGAGKTTTFSVITGDLPMSSGSVTVDGYNISTNLRDVQQRIGYCPQFDALIECMTGRELLTMFARLRGIPERQIKQVVNTEITRVDLKKYADTKCGKYSGGNKRKLSTAVALVGNPPIILLDEPTTGMDPATRRYTWDVLTNIRNEGRSIILTTHSMEECEALCTRIAIMVNGSFKCLGSIQHLKNKFGSGLILQAKVACKESPVDSLGGKDVRLSKRSLHDFIREKFSGAVLLEEHQGTVSYQLPSGGLSWSAVFRILEDNKEDLEIIDYSVSQTNLEQVFVTFAKTQGDDV